MLCWPFLSFFSASRLLPGGDRKKSKVWAASSTVNLRSATDAIDRNRFGLCPSKRAWVSLHLNDWITVREYYAARNIASVLSARLRKQVLRRPTPKVSRRLTGAKRRPDGGLERLYAGRTWSTNRPLRRPETLLPGDTRARHRSGVCVGWASLSAAPVRWPTLEVGDSKDDQLRGFGSVHHGEREAFREDAPRLQLPWRTKLRMRGSKSGSCHHGLTELISEPLLLLFV